MEKGIKLIGSKFYKVEASRIPDFSGKATMSNDIKILLIENPQDNKDALKIKYSYKLNYGELGHINLEGFLFITSDSKTIKTIVKDFENKNFKSPEQLAITNLIVQKASVRAIQLEDELGLPIHFRLPQFGIKE